MAIRENYLLASFLLRRTRFSAPDEGLPGSAPSDRERWISLFMAFGFLEPRIPKGTHFSHLPLICRYSTSGVDLALWGETLPGNLLKRNEGASGSLLWSRKFRTSC